MRLTRLLIATALLAVTACTNTDTIAGPGPTSPNGPGLVESSTLQGFVAIHPNGDVRLLAGGDDILLTGAIDLVAPLAGLEVVVAGRFIDEGWFWVDTVAVVSPETDPQGLTPV